MPLTNVSMPTRKRKQPAKTQIKLGNPWEAYPELLHLTGEGRVRMERRRRHRAVRYGLFRLQTAVVEEQNVVRACADLPAGFAGFWLDRKPSYAMAPGQGGVLVKADVPIGRDLPVEKLGGYAEFARLWDVDEDLNVYLRHSSVWQEWNAKLMRVVPILGEH